MLNLEDVYYDINWDAFLPGTSIFLPCLSCVEARKRVLFFLKTLQFDNVCKISIEDGVRGLRVWRI